MKIIAYAPNYIPSYCAGDTTMLHDILKFMVSKGHEVTVMVNKIIEPYEIDGIPVIPRQSTAFKRFDLIICQLDVTTETIRLAAGKPIIWIMHNTFPYPSVTQNPHVAVVYNAEWAIKATNYPDNPYYVLPPPVDREYFDFSKGRPAHTWLPEMVAYVRENVTKKITLINCNENKGGKIFHEIAKSMPDRQFMAVLGAYGQQYVSLPDDGLRPVNLDNKAKITGLGHLPNVTVIENTPDMLHVYAQTQILLMPSLYESWGRVATEAMCSGIPVICTPTEGLKENCGESATFIEDRENINQWVMAIKKLDSKREYDEASARAKKRSYDHNSKEKLEGFEQFAKKVVTGHTPKKEHGSTS